MTLRYKLLLVDHDDTTAADTTPLVHYLSNKKTLGQLRPEVKLTCDDFFRLIFDSRVTKFLQNDQHFNEEEMKIAYKNWRESAEDISQFPGFYPGMIEALAEYKDKGGLFVVVSASEPHVIRQHYRTDGRIIPDYIFGHNGDRSKNKPNPYPINKSLEMFNEHGHNLGLEDILVVDDSKPGLTMAKSAGDVDFAAAAWSKYIPQQIRDYMRANSDVYLESVEHFRNLILKEGQDGK